MSQISGYPTRLSGGRERGLVGANDSHLQIGRGPLSVSLMITWESDGGAKIGLHHAGHRAYGTGISSCDNGKAVVRARPCSVQGCQKAGIVRAFPLVLHLMVGN